MTEEEEKGKQSLFRMPRMEEADCPFPRKKEKDKVSRFVLVQKKRKRSNYRENRRLRSSTNVERLKGLKWEKKLSLRDKLHLTSSEIDHKKRRRWADDLRTRFIGRPGAGNNSLRECSFLHNLRTEV